MRKYLLFILLFVGSVAYSSPRSPEVASAIAQAWFAEQQVTKAPLYGKGVSVSSKHTATPALSYTRMQKGAASPAVYVFNQEGAGFVLISADDATREVLGFADHSTFDPANIPANVQFWLDRYTSEVSYAAQAGLAPSTATVATYTPVAPLCTAQWNQDSPFNNLCPEKNGEHTVTGCVATAAAQVMYANKYPISGTGTHSYAWNGQTLTANFGNTTYYWSRMLDSYDGSYTANQANAVATLMLHCGIACDMEYDLSAAGGSGAVTNTMVNALTTYFGYDAGIKTLLKDYMPEQQMLNEIAADLQAGHTILMNGRTSSNEGHAFVCDGMNANGYLHINWGWGGYCDGYFALSALDPEGQGIGGASSGYAFTEQVGAFINIKPNEGGNPVITPTAQKITWQSGDKTEQNYGITLAITEFMNSGITLINGELACNVYRADGTLYTTVSAGGNIGELKPGYYFTDDYYVTPSLNAIPDGSYMISVGIKQNGVFTPFLSYGIGEQFFSLRIENGYIYQGEGQVEQPVSPDPIAVPEGTLNVYEANALCRSLAADVATDQDYFVKGWVSEVREVNTGQYGNATFYIRATQDDTSTETFYAWRVYGRDNQKFTDANAVQVGDFVVLKGKLIHYKGNTPETVTNKAYVYASTNDAFLNDYKVRILPLNGCTMDCSNGLWIYYWGALETGCIPATKTDDGWYEATVSTHETAIGVLAVNCDVNINGWYDAEQTYDFLPVAGDVCLGIGATDGWKYSLEEIACDTKPYDPSSVAPTNLRATTTDGYHYTFTWQAGQEPAPLYQMEVLYQGNGNYRTINTEGFTDAATLCINTAYTWQVSALNEDGIVVATTVYDDTLHVSQAPDYGVRNLMLTENADTCYLQWESIAPLFRINVYGERENDYYGGFDVNERKFSFAKSVLDGLGETSYLLEILPVNEEYTFYIGDGASEVVSFLPADADTYKPYDLQATPSYGQMHFTWKSNAGSHYKVRLWNETLGVDQIFSTDEPSLVINFAAVFNNMPVSWSVATVDADGNRLSEWVEGPVKTLPENPYPPTNLVFTPINAHSATFRWRQGNAVASGYLLLIKDIDGNVVHRERVDGYECTVNELADGSYGWLVYALDAEGNALGFSNGASFSVPFDVVTTYYTLTTDVIGQGSITRSPDLAQYEEGTQVTLTAIPAEGWEFYYWSDGIKESVRTLTITANTTLTATFKEIDKPKNYTLTTDVIGQGTISRSPDLAQYEEGAQVTLTATPADGWVFSQWSDGETQAVRTLTITENTILTATFAKEQTYLLFTEVIGAGEVSVSPIKEAYPQGTQVTLTASPVEGYYFARWTGDIESTDAVITLTMNKDYYIQAIFQAYTTYRITIYEPDQPWGTTSPEAGSYEVREGEQFTVTATADTGYAFDYWSVNTDELKDNPLVLTDIQKQYKIQPVFKVANTALNDAETEGNTVEKLLIDGVLFIRSGSVLYDAQGKRVERK